MPEPPRISRDLHTEIRVVCDMMLKAHYFEEANWLWMAVGSKACCTSRSAQNALREAAVIAWEFGFPNVRDWLRSQAIVDGAAEWGRTA